MSLPPCTRTVTGTAPAGELRPDAGRIARGSRSWNGRLAGRGGRGNMAEPTRTRTRLAREERREQIVDAAAEVFQGRNPADVTFEEIADAAGVSRALVYNYFGDR